MGSEKAYRDEIWLREQVRIGQSPEEIAELCSVTPKTIERWIEKHEIRPYRDEDWLKEQISRHIPERTIASWCCVTDQTIKRWMKRYNIEHPGLAPAEVLQDHLEDKFDTIEEVDNEIQIQVLWQRYMSRVTKSAIATAVGCTPSYVRDVIGSPANTFTEHMEYAEFSGSETVPADVKKQVRKRDDDACKKCGSVENTQLHHIIPGQSDPVNLVVLCRSCHEDAHAGDFHEPGFSYETREEFWNNWVEEDI